ncbi:MAG TPA: hypothetical protein VFH25_04525 [Nitrososphaeraceae archaeon]|nr:hypothetical protein [Nitrososphaeraceae archaeon]
MTIMRTHYEVVSTKRPLCIGEDNDKFRRKLENKLLSRETSDDMIYNNKSNGILVQEKREKYIYFNGADAAIDFNLKGYTSDLGTLKNGRQVLKAMCYKLS